MAKKPKSNARDKKKETTSVSRPKIEFSLGEKLKAAGIVEGISNREDPVVRRVDCDSYRDRVGESKSDSHQTDRDELNRAYLGVEPLRNKKERRAYKNVASIADHGTRCEQTVDRITTMSQLNLSVTPGFEINWDRDGDVTALRRDVERDELNSLFGRRFKPEATLDLHGTISKDVERKVSRFVRDQYRQGKRRLLLVHGKGKHSDQGVGVLADHLVKVLTQSRVSHYVRGFCTASLEHGGSGALAVMLIS